MIAFAAALIPRVVLCMNTYPVRTISDEIATMSGAAYFAGLDWSGVISKAGYYGSGFYSFFFWLFKLTDNPFIIYKCMLIASSIVQASVAIVAFIIMKRYFQMKDGRVLCLFSIVSSYLVVTRANLTYNEHIMILITWVITWILLELRKSMGQKVRMRVLTVVLMLILSYSLTIHTRALTLWIACGFVIAIYYFVNRQWLVSKLVVVLGGGIGYILGQRFVLMIQNAIWAADGGGVRNGAVNIAINFQLSDPTTWFAGISVIFGQLNTISVFTGGFMILSFVALTWMMFAMLKERISKKVVVKTEDKNQYLIIGVLVLSSVGMTIAAQTISWLPGVINGIKDGIGTKEYAMKALTYIRYFGPYLGPAFMAGLVLGYKNLDWFKRYLKPSVMIFFLLQIYWVIGIIPFIKNNGYTKEVFTALAWKLPSMPTVVWTYLPGVIITSILFVLIVLLYKKGKTVLPAALLCVLLIYQYVYCSINNDLHFSKAYMMRANAGYALAQEMEDKKTGLPDTLYVFDSSDKVDHQIFYLYQFLLNRYKIIPELPKAGNKDAVVFSNSGKVKQLLELGYQCIKLDKNEFVYANEDMAEQIRNCWVK